MIFTTVKSLSELDPAGAIIGKGASIKHGSPLTHPGEARFLARYSNLAYGWHVANQFAWHRKTFPQVMMRRDYWVFRAYLMMLDPVRNYDENVAEAFHFANLKSSESGMGNAMQALILSGFRDKKSSPVQQLRAVANRTGIPFETVEAFETLFFNIIDRHEDALYIANAIYPNHRIVELDDAYFDNTPIGDLIKRAGYNYQDMDLTSYLIGMGDRSYIAKLAASDSREAELGKHIMGNGLILTQTGLINQRSIGLSRATTLMAASRQGGNTTEDPAIADVTDFFLHELKIATKVNQKHTVEAMKRDAGQIVEAEVTAS